MENGECEKRRSERGQSEANAHENGDANSGGVTERRSVNKKRKLVLHFDVRNTVLVADSVTNVNVDDALNSYLTGVTWGHETTKGWEWFSDAPSLNPPRKDAITYYKHLERILVKRPSDRAILRKATGNFTQETIGERFLPQFVKHIKLLEWPYPDVTDSLLTMQGSTGKLYHYMLPCFFNMIHYLYENERDFSIVFRTYGMDAPTVLECTKETLAGRHPGFTRPLPINVNCQPGKIQRSKNGIVLEHVPQNGSEKTHYRSERDVFNFLSNTTGVCGFVDDFEFWQDNGYSHYAAKPLWVNPSDRTTHHILFDDNIRVTDHDSIVDLRVFDPATGSITSLPKEKAARYEDACVVQADLLQSTENENYFIDKLNLCEENYDKLIRPRINGIW